MIVRIIIVIIKNCSALLSLRFSMEINSINKVILWKREREINVLIYQHLPGHWVNVAGPCKYQVAIYYIHGNE